MAGFQWADDAEFSQGRSVLADKTLVIDYKDPSSLKYFVTERGKIASASSFGFMR